jgi:hypothetical protein
LKNKFYIVLISSLLLALTACGDISVEDGTTDASTTNTSTSTNADSSSELVEEVNSGDSSSLKIIGKITYDRVGVNSNGVGLDYNNITQEPAKQVVVQAIDSSGAVVATTTTDDSGNYSLINLPKETKIKIRVSAQLAKSGSGGWSVKVVDNTNGDAQYVIEGSLVSTGTSSTRRNINASSGWGSGSYSGTREAAPFAILGSIYQAMQKVISSDSSATFPPLVVNWSKNNIASAGSIADGQIVTSYFTENENGLGNLYILGYAGNDTDEYDDHIIIHEWGHYFESKFSRADSPGGNHSPGERLDIRLAFGEGWGNAWSAIATDNPIYTDTVGTQQASNAILMNIESDPNNTPNDTNDWSSEGSIQRILYDIYDSNNDGEDILSMGFTPMYKVLIDAQKNTEALTSIFSFITALKQENPLDANKIDTLLLGEDISEIQDIYGTTHHNLYSDMEIGDVKKICTSTVYGTSNKLYTHRYIRFVVSQNGVYKIKMLQQFGRTSADPDFALYRVGTAHENLGSSAGDGRGVEENSIELTAGNYILDASNYNAVDACFNVTITAN